ncbi:hypothetical protein P7C70_g8043, partial [Phenoliferia sp. Uapishka_3]
MSGALASRVAQLLGLDDATVEELLPRLTSTSTSRELREKLAHHLGSDAPTLSSATVSSILAAISLFRSPLLPEDNSSAPLSLHSPRPAPTTYSTPSSSARTPFRGIKRTYSNLHSPTPSDRPTFRPLPSHLSKSTSRSPATRAPVPTPTANGGLKFPPARNPFEALSAPDFDNFVDGLTSTIRNALAGPPKAERRAIEPEREEVDESSQDVFGEVKELDFAPIVLSESEEEVEDEVEVVEVEKAASPPTVAPPSPEAEAVAELDEEDSSSDSDSDASDIEARLVQNILLPRKIPLFAPESVTEDEGDDIHALDFQITEEEEEVEDEVDEFEEEDEFEGDEDDEGEPMGYEERLASHGWAQPVAASQTSRRQEDSEEWGSEDVGEDGVQESEEESEEDSTPLPPPSRQPSSRERPAIIETIELDSDSDSEAGDELESETEDLPQRPKDESATLESELEDEEGTSTVGYSQDEDGDEDADASSNAETASPPHLSAPEPEPEPDEEFDEEEYFGEGLPSRDSPEPDSEVENRPLRQAPDRRNDREELSGWDRDYGRKEELDNDGVDKGEEGEDQEDDFIPLEREEEADSGDTASATGSPLQVANAGPTPPYDSDSEFSFGTRIPSHLKGKGRAPTPPTPNSPSSASSSFSMESQSSEESTSTRSLASLYRYSLPRLESLLEALEGSREEAQLAGYHDRVIKLDREWDLVNAIYMHKKTEREEEEGEEEDGEFEEEEENKDEVEQSETAEERDARIEAEVALDEIAAALVKTHSSGISGSLWVGNDSLPSFESTGPPSGEEDVYLEGGEDVDGEAMDGEEMDGEEMAVRPEIEMEEVANDFLEAAESLDAFAANPVEMPNFATLAAATQPTLDFDFLVNQHAHPTDPPQPDPILPLTHHNDVSRQEAPIESSTTSLENSKAIDFALAAVAAYEQSQDVEVSSATQPMFDLSSLEETRTAPSDVDTAQLMKDLAATSADEDDVQFADPIFVEDQVDAQRPSTSTIKSPSDHEPHVDAPPASITPGGTPSPEETTEDAPPVFTTATETTPADEIPSTSSTDIISAVDIDVSEPSPSTVELTSSPPPSISLHPALAKLATDLASPPPEVMEVDDEAKEIETNEVVLDEEIIVEVLENGSDVEDDVMLVVDVSGEPKDLCSVDEDVTIQETGEVTASLETPPAVESTLDSASDPPPTPPEAQRDEENAVVTVAPEPKLETSEATTQEEDAKTVDTKGDSAEVIVEVIADAEPAKLQDSDQAKLDISLPIDDSLPHSPSIPPSP